MFFQVVEAIYKIKYLIFACKIHRGKIANTRKRQGKHREFHLVERGHSECKYSKTCLKDDLSSETTYHVRARSHTAIAKAMSQKMGS